MSDILGERLIQTPSSAIATILLAHGAGAAMDSSFMNLLADTLFEHDIEVIRFEFPYMQERRTLGKKRPPNKVAELVKHWQHMVKWAEMRGTLPIFIGGKSLGGRTASMFFSEFPVAALGCICYGYPFHPPKKPDSLRVDHLVKLQKALLILQGTRDPFGVPEEVAGYGLTDRVQLHWLESGDHDFSPLKRSGLTQSQLIEQAAAYTRQYIESIL